MSLTKAIEHGKEHRAKVKWRRKRFDNYWYGRGELRRMLMRYKARRGMKGVEPDA